MFSASSSVCDNKFSASETIYSALQASGIWLVRASSFMKYFPNLPETINILSILMRFFVFRAFISADKDFDGKVDEGEFEGMISAAAAFPQKFGFEFWKGSGEVFY